MADCRPRAPLAHLVERRTFNPVGRVRVPHGALQYSRRRQLLALRLVSSVRHSFPVPGGWIGRTGPAEAQASVVRRAGSCRPDQIVSALP
jgi:hypothetical protein